jgi:hypothetical protein
MKPIVGTFSHVGNLFSYVEVAHLEILSEFTTPLLVYAVFSVRAVTEDASQIPCNMFDKQYEKELARRFGVSLGDLVEGSD